MHRGPEQQGDDDREDPEPLPRGPRGHPVRVRACKLTGGRLREEAGHFRQGIVFRIKHFCVNYYDQTQMFI